MRIYRDRINRLPRAELYFIPNFRVRVVSRAPMFDIDSSWNAYNDSDADWNASLMNSIVGLAVLWCQAMRTNGRQNSDAFPATRRRVSGTSQGPFTQRYVMRHRSPQNLGSALGVRPCQLRRPSANLWRPQFARQAGRCASPHPARGAALPPKAASRFCPFPGFGPRHGC